MLPCYGRIGIPNRLVVDLAGQAVHVLADPSAGGYRTTERATGKETLTMSSPGDATLAVADVLGPG